MASRQGGKGTTWLLWQFYLMSSKPLAPTCYPFITLLWRDICDKIEMRERENEPIIVGGICDSTDCLCYFHLPCSTAGILIRAFGGGGSGPSRRTGVSETQVGRHWDPFMGIIEEKQPTNVECTHKIHTKEGWREEDSLQSDTRWRDIMQREPVKANCLLKLLLTGTKAKNACLSVSAQKGNMIHKHYLKMIW